VLDVRDEVVVAIQLQALEIRIEGDPFWLSLQASTAYDGIAVAAMLV
jgi:hypothetical protein